MFMFWFQAYLLQHVIWLRRPFPIMPIKGHLYASLCITRPLLLIASWVLHEATLRLSQYVVPKRLFCQQ